MRDVEAAHIAQLDAFELLPQAFVRIEFGGVCRQALQVQPLSRAIRQNILRT